MLLSPQQATAVGPVHTPPVDPLLSTGNYIIEYELGPKDSKQEEYEVAPGGYDSSFKTYMDYKMITNTSSKQWALQQKAYTDENGLRKVDDYYCVAMGSGIAQQIGDKFVVTFDTGAQIKVILADHKADIHTDQSNRYVDYGNGKINIIEFVVETEKMPDIVRVMGDVGCMPGNLFFGNVVSIKGVE